MVDRPTMNPTLTLISKPRGEPTTGGGKGRNDVRRHLLAKRMRGIRRFIEKTADSRSALQSSQGGSFVALVTMDSKSQSATKSPRDLFDPSRGCRIISPWRNGFLVEASQPALDKLKVFLDRPNLPVPVQVDISRVLKIELLADRLAGEEFSGLWKKAQNIDGVRQFIGTVVPYFSKAARVSVSRDVHEIGKVRTIPDFSLVEEPLQFQAIAPPRIDNEGGRPALSRRTQTTGTPESRSPTEPDMPNIAAFADRLSERSVVRIIVQVRDQEQLASLVSSGVVHRWEPVMPIVVADSGHTNWNAPDPFPDTATPTVGVIDGGLNEPEFQSAVAWRDPPLVPDQHADTDHGARVVCLIANGPSTPTSFSSARSKIGVVQAVAKNPSYIFDPIAFLQTIDRSMRAHPETRVWNLSANLPEECDEFNVSFLADELGQIARKHKNLLVISAGNRVEGRIKLAPPADCEAALVVAGRKVLGDGTFKGSCKDSCLGLGPDGQLKPDVSFQSAHKFSNGTDGIGTSYAGPPIASVAAHGFELLQDPSPDLIKALVVDSCDLSVFRHDLGFGTPFLHSVPWLCPDDAIVMAWRSRLQTGARYYWTDIHIPSDMIRDRQLVGQIRLTAIIAPLVDMNGSGNYCSSRVETALQYERNPDDWDRLIGSLPVETEEAKARAHDAKWEPLRSYRGSFVHPDQFKRGMGQMRRKSAGPNLRVMARVYTRNDFRNHIAKEAEHEVSFVLSLRLPSSSTGGYDEFVRSMGSKVTSGVIEQKVELQV